MKKHKFKGNVRELKMILDRLEIYNKSKNLFTEKDIKVVLDEISHDDSIDEIEIPQELNGQVVKLVHSLLAKAALNQSSNNHSKAGKLLGIKHPMF